MVNASQGRRGGARVIAYLGKGGAGKTVMSALTGVILAGRGRTLLIDADPALGLSLAVGRACPRTVGEVREDVIAAARSGAGSGEKISMTIDYLILEALCEYDDFSLLVMGRSEGPGCFCPVNSLLRESIEELAGSFDYMVIDAEAGMEQVSRQLTRRVDHPVIVTDTSVRGARAALAINDMLAGSGQRPAAGVIVNRVDEAGSKLSGLLDDGGLSCLGTVPDDPAVAHADGEGSALTGLPSDSPALVALGGVLERWGIVPSGDRPGNRRGR